MDHSTNLLTLNYDSEKAIEQLTRRLAGDGFHVVRTFNLKTARTAHTKCNCPHHGTDDCDCQLIVLQVYNKRGQPLTLVAHSQDGNTHFELVDSPQQRPQRLIKAAVLQALALEGFAAIKQSESTHFR